MQMEKLQRRVRSHNQLRRIISVLLENESGSLSRVAALFSARGYNIESLTVAPTDDDTLSRMTIVTVGSDRIIEQITKQLNKLVDVVRVVDLTDGPHIERELLLAKLVTTNDSREEAKRLIDIFRGRIVDVTDVTYTIELTGPGDKLDAFMESLGDIEIMEIVRSGVSGIARGNKLLKP